MEDVIDGFEGFGAKLFIGGPVALDTLHYMHRMGERIPGSVEVAKGIYWGGDFEVIKELVADKEITPNDIKFFLGYTGWTKDTMEEDVAEWIAHKTKPKYVFNSNPESIWREVLIEKGGQYQWLVNAPKNIKLN